MEQEKKVEARLIEFRDKSIIAEFPPGFFQKGTEHLKTHQDEQFVIQITKTRIYLRKMRALVGGKRPKDRINGQVITWIPSNIKEFDG